MSKIQILDCTLRDGGYCNAWRFGKGNIIKVLQEISRANVEVIEVGYLTNKANYDVNVTKFTSVKQVDSFNLLRNDKTKYVLMVNYGEYDASELPMCNETDIDGIRVAFHQKNWKDALSFCEEIQKKGYLVFVQPMVTMLYSDEEFTEMLAYVNSLKPYAMYIVDSFGTMERSELSHFLQLIKSTLNLEINIGFHSHNNYQSAFSNAQLVIDDDSPYGVIIDSSVYGMGRGAGNLNTELLINEINKRYPDRYLLKPILKCMDEVIHAFYKEKPWGYSLPNYLSATHMVHPNYAIYLSEKNSLTVDAIDEIFSRIERDKASEFDSKYIEELYLEYMSQGRINEGKIEEIKKTIKGRKVLLIAPGKTAYTEREVIVKYINEKSPVVVSINHEYEETETDYLFISNMRRFHQIPQTLYGRVIATSNINVDSAYATVSYYSLINTVETVRDNSGLMAIRFFINMGADSICLAGFDGYDYAAKNNYENDTMLLIMNEAQIDALNTGMKQVLEAYQKEINIEFLTKSRFKRIE